MITVRNVKNNIAPYVFLLPSGIIFLIFTLVPIISGAVLTFFKWDFMSTPVFIGLGNWMNIFSDKAVLQSLLITFKFVLLIVPSGIILGIFLALLLDKLTFGKNTFRAIFFAPVVTSSVAMSFVMKAMFRESSGLLNFLFEAVGIGGINWLSNSGWVVITCAIYILWQSLGLNILIFLAGLQSIPDTVYEASDIDGCNSFNRFFKITLPLLSPSTFFVFVTSTINSMQVFDQIYTLTKGGPGYATTTIVYTIYRSAFIEYKMGYAATSSMVLLVLLLIVTCIQWRYQERWVFYG